MNEKQIENSEKIASKILRVLAIVGLVAVLALAAWAIVQSAKFLPNLGNNIVAGVTSVTNIFRSEPEESITFDIDSSTIAVGSTAVFSWSFEGENKPKKYLFSYSCDTDVKISTMMGAGWIDLDCDTPFETEEESISIITSNEESRFSDVELKVLSGDIEGTTIITVVNTDVLTNRSEIGDESTDEDNTNEEESTQNSEQENNTTVIENNTNNSNGGSGTETVVRQTTKKYSGPANLVVEIEETGIILEVDGEDTFFPVDPVHSDKVAGVRFTVTNKGGETSEVWTFNAELPIEGDDEYEYESPKQIPLASGMQIEYTLGFDEVLQEEDGTIKITLNPNDDDDKESDNTDSVTIEIRVKEED